MARGATSSILLMLSLEALLLVAGSSAHVGGGGVADLATATASAITHGVGEERPWECCDNAMCTRSFPPTCRCLDVVDRCSCACKRCEETEDGRHACTDWYHTDVGEQIPMCHHGDRHAAAAARATKGGGDDEKRPWKCCNMPICAKSFPPICYCTDMVKQCASTCERCEQVEDSDVYRCLDAYRGQPGPRCEEHEEMWAPSVASAHRFFLARKE